MKKQLFWRIISLCLAVVCLVGCDTEKQATDSGFINVDEYEDVKYWESEKLEIVSNVSIQSLELNEAKEDLISQEVLELSRSQEEKIKSLKKAISAYFSEKYNIDFTEKLEKQNVTFFSGPSVEDSIIMGYVDNNDSNTLHLNIRLNDEEEDLFESTYIHETLHQLGFIDKSCKMTYIVEGIVDAYTDLILKAVNGNSQPTALYFEARQLGYQMIASDKELPKVIIDGALKEHMNKDLRKYKQKFEHKDDLAGYLNTLLYVLISINSRCADSENAYYYAFDAQGIVQKFCQAQNLDAETISYIRKHYLIEKFEILEVVDEGGGRYAIEITE